MSQAQSQRIHALKQRHEALKKKISDARKSPSIDDVFITQLKKEKLVVKEQIESHAAG